MAYNFRKEICKNLKKGTWLYGLFDCKRYEPTIVWREICLQTGLLKNEWCPATENRPFVSGTEPTTICEVHAKPIAKVPNPFWKTGKILGYDATIFCWTITCDNDLFKEAWLPEYFDALVADGITVTRGFMATMDGTSDWNFFMPWIGQDMKTKNPEYFGHFDDGQPSIWIPGVIERRLKMIKDRDLTAICTIVPYGGGEMTWSPDFPIYLDNILELLKPFLPNIIIETVNEGGAGSERAQRMIVDAAIQKGFPLEHIQLSPWDGGGYAELLGTVLNGQGLGCWHWYGTMESVEAPWPKGWTDSPGGLELLKLGTYLSNDGAGDGHGLKFSWDPDGVVQRSNPQELYGITRWGLRHYNKFTGKLEEGRGFEHLSAAAFQTTGRPDLRAAIEIGREERQAMARAYRDIYPE